MKTDRRLRPFHIWIALCLASFAGIFFQETHVSSLIIFVLIQPVMALGVMNPKLSFFGPVIYKADSNNALALSFDDGPDPAITPEILDLLARYGIKASFFVIAEKAAKYPALVRRAFEEGHIIACHDLNHSVFSNFRLKAAMVKDIERSREIIHGIIGHDMAIYRPPVGLTNPHLFGALKRCGMNCVCWSISGRDAGNRSSEGVARIASLVLQGSDIVLLHDALPDPSMKLLVLDSHEKLIRNILASNLSCLTLDKLLGIEAYAD